MNNSFDIIIIGAGAFGSSAAYHLSKTNKRVLVIDKHHPPHSFGSSHGKTRIIREAYFENPIYVPLVRQAYTLWDELEKESSENLFLKTGGLMIGNKQSHVIEGTLNSAFQYNINHEILDHEQTNEKFPLLNSDRNTIAVYEKNAGILFPEKCIHAALQIAGLNGVKMNFNEFVVSIKQHGSDIEIKTDQETYLTEKCIISAGAWMSKLLPELKLPLKTTRQVLFWYKADENSGISSLPVFIWNTENGKHFYGFPDKGDGFKIAFHDKGNECDPDNLNRNVSETEVEEMNETIKQHFTFSATYKESVVCIYTNTPDDHFIIDHHPADKNIIIASPCSGHGFKFSSVIGRILADISLNNQIDFDLTPFSLNRFNA